MEENTMPQGSDLDAQQNTDPGVEHEFENFDFEFHNMVGELGELERALHTEAVDRLLKLAEGHTDVTGAAIAIEREDKQAQTGYLIRARVVAYTRPEYTTGIEKDENAMGALKGALSKVERQVRETRKKFRDTRRQPKDDRLPESPAVDEVMSDLPIPDDDQEETR